MEPKNPNHTPLVKPVAETIAELTAVIETGKTKARKLQSELQADVTEIDGAARACDQWAAVLEKLLAAVSNRRDSLDKRQDAASDALAAIGAGEMGGTQS